jgi:NADH-quinone oxidoreductase subunit L
MAALPLWAVALLPAVVGLALLLTGRRSDPVAGALAILAAAGCAALAGLAWSTRPESAVQWLPIRDGGLDLTLDAGGIGAPLALLVAATAFLVLVYAQADIGQGEARARFFGFMALFVGGMQLVVLAGDLLTLLIGFEVVGVCSYALIGFWWRDGPRVLAANRAFITTRAADLGLYLAAMSAYAGAGTLALEDLADAPDPWRTVIVLGLIAAAAGKSAQLPFSGWLSGAMLGPSPVSALLHSATMVAAGVVLLLKALPLLEAIPSAASLVLWLGVLSALGAALVALHQEDLKQLLAASTVSQYGYMFAGVGALGGAAAASHLVAHATFKALLFLIAGVLLHQGMKRFEEMGGLRRPMPVQAGLFLVAVLSLAALPPTSGFFTKEALLVRIEQTSVAAFLVLLVVTLLTAAYAIRALLGAFAGGRRLSSKGGIRPHEPAMLMTSPEIFLALAVLLLATLMLPPLEHQWSAALGQGGLPGFHTVSAAVAVALALAGALGIWVLHRRGCIAPLRPLLGDAGSRAALDWFGSVRALDHTGELVLKVARALDRLDRAEPATHVGLSGLKAARHLRAIDLTEPATRIGLNVLRVARGIAAFDTVAVDGGLFLWTLQRLFLGDLDQRWAVMPDMTLPERLGIFPLLALVVLIGVLPFWILEVIDGFSASLRAPPTTAVR